MLWEYYCIFSNYITYQKEYFYSHTILVNTSYNKNILIKNSKKYVISYILVIIEVHNLKKF